MFVVVLEIFVVVVVLVVRGTDAGREPEGERGERRGRGRVCVCVSVCAELCVCVRTYPGGGGRGRADAKEEDEVDEEEVRARDDDDEEEDSMDGPAPAPRDKEEEYKDRAEEDAPTRRAEELEEDLGGGGALGVGPADTLWDCWGERRDSSTALGFAFLAMGGSVETLSMSEPSESEPSVLKKSGFTSLSLLRRCGGDRRGCGGRGARGGSARVRRGRQRGRESDRVRGPMLIVCGRTKHTRRTRTSRCSTTWWREGDGGVRRTGRCYRGVLCGRLRRERRGARDVFGIRGQEMVVPLVVSEPLLFHWWTDLFYV